MIRATTTVRPPLGRGGTGSYTTRGRFSRRGRGRGRGPPCGKGGDERDGQPTDGVETDKKAEIPGKAGGLAEVVRVAKLRNVAAGRFRRRSSMRGAMDFAVSLRGEPADSGSGEGKESEEEKKDKDQKAKDDAVGAVATTAFAVAVGATVLRVGGRAALLSVAGLDFIRDTGLRDQVDQAVAYADGLGPYGKVAVFAGAWCVTKIACLDALGVVLAISSGVLFGGVWQGGLASATCATIGSAAAFGLGRTVLRERVAPEVEKRAALRAVERAVSTDGFRTVLTLRLAPVLPIPLGMYSYVYGASTSLALPEFLAGTLVASLKPYTLDAYLGIFAKSVVDGEPGDNDAVLLATFAVVVLIGTLASQIATRTWEEVQAELALEEEQAKKDGKGVEAEDGGGFAWMGLLGQKADEDGPRLWLTSAWDRLWAILELEHAAATHKLPPPPRLPSDWADRPLPAELHATSAEEADELYNRYLLESSLAWLLILQGIAKFSSKNAPLPSWKLSAEAARRAVAEKGA